MTIQETLAKYLVGRRVTAADRDTLTLDDGTTLSSPRTRRYFRRRWQGR